MMVETSDKYRQIAEVLISIPRFFSREKIRQLGPENIASIVESITHNPDDRTRKTANCPHGYRCTICGIVMYESWFDVHQRGKELLYRACRYCSWRIKTKADELYRQQLQLPPRSREGEMLPHLNPEQRDSLETFLAYRATTAPSENELRIRLPDDAYERGGFYGPNSDDIPSAISRPTKVKRHRTERSDILVHISRPTKVKRHRTERSDILSWWTSTHDAVVEWFLQSYGMFVHAAEGVIALEIKRLRGMEGNLPSHFGDFLLNRIHTKTHLWNLYASDYLARYKESHSCRACGAREYLIDLDPENLEATFGHVLPLCNRHWKSYRLTVGESQLHEGPLTDLDSLLGEHSCPVCNQTHSWRDRIYTHTSGFYGIPIPERHREICFSCLNTAINRQPRSYATKQDLAGVLEISQSLGQLPGDNMFHVLIRQAPKVEVAASIVRRMQSMVRFDTLKRKYGSWFAVLAHAGCLPEGCRRENFGTRILAKDGHECRSLAEMTIDDALYRLNISHRKEVRYPNTGFICDWVVTRGDSIVFIEYFGLSGKESYDEKIVQKRAVLSKAGIELAELYYDDLESIEEWLLQFAPAQKSPGIMKRSTKDQPGPSAEEAGDR